MPHRCLYQARWGPPLPTGPSPNRDRCPTRGMEKKPLRDPFAELEDNPLADSLKAEIVAAQEPKGLAEANEEFRKMADELERKANVILHDILAFRDINPLDPVPDPDWNLSPEDREKRLRVAIAAWSGKKEAPVGLSLAASIAVGLAKARASEKEKVQAPQLNVTVAVLTAPIPQFEEIIVERSDRD